MQGYMERNTQQDENIRKFLPLVGRLANRLAMGLPAHIDKEELISSGIMGLLDALERYNPAKGKLKSYVSLRVKGAMLDELRRLSWLPRSLLTKSKAVEKQYMLLCAELKRAPSDAELSERLQISSEEMSLLAAQINSKSLIHLEDYLFSADGGSRQIKDYIRDPNEYNSPEDSLIKREQTDMLADAVDSLSQREQQILHLYYKEELTLKEIGQVFNVSESRISQIHSRIMLKLRLKMQEEDEA